MQLKNHQAHIYSGGGITKHSDPEKEWEETVSKSYTIKSVIF
jgi:isochorismate synthase